MDRSSNRENGRNKQDQHKGLNTQWTIPPHMLKDPQALSMKFISIINERDSALEERNEALTDKRTALAERDMALLQRDAAMGQRDSAIMERANVIEAYEHEENNTAPNGNSPSPCSPEDGTPLEWEYPPPALAVSTPASEFMKRRKAKQLQEAKTDVSQTSKKGKTSEDKRLVLSNPGSDDWRGDDAGLTLIDFDNIDIPAPFCSCTGNPQQCYRWGHGGWQSPCCTSTLSCYPLPMMPNKRHNRMAGRKMSGTVFNKLLTRFAAEGHDLTEPVDLKDHWAKHGTNRYITIK